MGNRKHQQAEIIFKIGRFFGPLLSLAENPSNYDLDEQRRIAARFFAERDALIQEVQRFSTDEPGHSYFAQSYRVRNALFTLGAAITSAPEGHWLSQVKASYDTALSAILEIPIPIDSSIHDAQTPFSTYCFLLDLCSTVTREIVWLDRYFDQTVFHRFFVDTPKTALITLVTLPDTNLSSRTDQRRFTEFLDISRIFAKERGESGYRLIENASFHDRWLRCDDRLFALGGSVKDLDQIFTISRIDSNSDNLRQFDEAVKNGVEAFGPKRLNHK